MRFFIKFLILFLIFAESYAVDLKKEIILTGEWLFKIGDNLEYASPKCDVSNWEKIQVPGCWEERGYPGYDGYAWYRIKFYIPKKLEEKSLILSLGRIDDIDEVYINGKFLDKTGSPLPNYNTAYDKRRKYNLPVTMLKFDQENLLAVRVYDHQGCGGIVDHNIGVYSKPGNLKLLVNLDGDWKFKTGDNPQWADEKFVDEFWETITVPSKWESAGYGNYDGFGWYRKSFEIDKKIKGEKLILALGKVDDMDEIYLNGTRIGRTGLFDNQQYKNRNNPFWNQQRFYFLPNYLLKYGKKNVIAVRVFDVWSIGGIYEGPIGIMTRSEYYRLKDIRW